MRDSRTVIARKLLASLASITFASALYHLIPFQSGPRLEMAFFYSVILVPTVAAGTR